MHLHARAARDQRCARALTSPIHIHLGHHRKGRIELAADELLNLLLRPWLLCTKLVAGKGHDSEAAVLRRGDGREEGVGQQACQHVRDELNTGGTRQAMFLTLYFLCSSSRPAYWGVKPQALAVFTMRLTLPPQMEERGTSSLLMFFTEKS